MVSRKKLILLAVLSVFSLAIASGVALAAEKIGVIEPNTVLSQHPKMAQVRKQVQEVLQKKQEEAKAAIAKEKDDKKKAEIYQTKQNEAAVEEQKLMAPILKDIDVAIRSVAKAKGLTLVIDVAQALMGGVDITQDVIAELKKNP
jgi:outer membrane protein